MTNNIPDKLYDRSRDELLAYEDSEFRLLMSNVPNFYISQTDQTIWGSLLRDVAAELGRLEYFHTYDIIGKDPSYLTPADAKRQWNDPLFINKKYPPVDKYDLDYKNLVLSLIKAFQMGATVKSIQSVIKAYSGQDIIVEELWKSIGSRYDGTVRNMLKLSVRVGGAGTSSLLSLDSPREVENAAVSINMLSTITNDLYGAIDLAKPAHVGLDMIIVLGMDEYISDLVSGSLTADIPEEEAAYRLGRIEDELRIKILLVEREPIEDPLYQAPFLDVSHPDTGLASTEAITEMRKVFTPDPFNPPAPPLNGTSVGYTLEEFTHYQAQATTGTVTTVGTEPPHPGILSPVLNRVWETTDDNLEILDMD